MRGQIYLMLLMYNGSQKYKCLFALYFKECWEILSVDKNTACFRLQQLWQYCSNSSGYNVTVRLPYPSPTQFKMHRFRNIFTLFCSSYIIWKCKITFSTPQMRVKWWYWGTHFDVIGKPLHDFLIPVHWSYFDFSSGLRHKSTKYSEKTWFSSEGSLRRYI